MEGGGGGGSHLWLYRPRMKGTGFVAHPQPCPHAALPCCLSHRPSRMYRPLTAWPAGCPVAVLHNHSPGRYLRVVQPALSSAGGSAGRSGRAAEKCRALQCSHWQTPADCAAPANFWVRQYNRQVLSPDRRSVVGAGDRWSVWPWGRATKGGAGKTHPALNAPPIPRTGVCQTCGPDSHVEVVRGGHAQRIGHAEAAHGVLVQLVHGGDAATDVVDAMHAAVPSPHEDGVPRLGVAARGRDGKRRALRGNEGGSARKDPKTRLSTDEMVAAPGRGGCQPAFLHPTYIAPGLHIDGSLQRAQWLTCTQS